MTHEKDGGFVKRTQLENKVKGTDKCSLIAVPVENLRRPEVVQVHDINDFTAKFAKSFEFNLRNTDGTLEKEKVKIEKYEDIELDVIAGQSSVLNRQEMEKDFLSRFIEEWKYNPAFKAQFSEILTDENRKKQVITFLSEIRNSLHKNETPTPLLDFLNNI